MPTWFVKECQDILICPIAKIVNTSLSSGVFPLSMKAALVKPLTKRHNFDCNVLNNYRPVSNLSYLSKIIERAVAVRLNKYLLDSNLIMSRQSASRTGHNTETALIRMKNYIMMSIDQSKAFINVWFIG